MRGWLLVIAALFGIQVTYGAFVAGLRAGLGFNTFPLMDGSWLAQAATLMTPLWINMIENGVMVQFIHRWLGAFLILVLFVGLFNALGSSRRLVAAWIGLTVCLFAQFALGVSTLVLHVPLSLASLHQGLAVIVMLVIVYLLYITKPSR